MFSKDGQRIYAIASSDTKPALREIAVGEIALTFLKEFTRFEDRARTVSEP